MPLFLSEEEYERCRNEASLIVEKADSFIRDLYCQLETVKAQADAAAITAEQTCSILEQKYISLSSEFSELQSQNSRLESSDQTRLSNLAQLQAEKHQLYLKSIEKDGEIERLSIEASEIHKSKRQLIELLGQKDLEISEKNATIKTYLDKIVNLTDTASMREAQLNDVEAELARCRAMCTRLSQEKELVERHNVWLNDELNAKVNSLIELRRTHTELEADMSSKLEAAERRYNECSNSLKWHTERVKELETKLKSLEEELCSSKDAAAASEARFLAEISTVTKLVELYKESSDEWSKKAGELEGVIKALETHLNQVENEYKEKLEKEVSARKDLEKEAADLKGKLEKCQDELETARKANELDILPLSSFTQDRWLDSIETNANAEDNRMPVPNIPLGVSGTALAASLLRDGWSLAKMYAKYQEAVDALRHEQLGRKQSQAILQRVLYEIEEKAEIILDERAEHERMIEAYSAINQKLQHSLSEQADLEKTIQKLKADLKRQGRDYTVAQKEIADLQKQVAVLLKECRDIQLRCGSADNYFAEAHTATVSVEMNSDSDAEKVISEHLLTFKDINGLVEQNTKLRSLVRSFSDQIDNREKELKERFEKDLQKHTEDAASRVAAVLERAEEQGRMIESLHSSVAMYKRLYEEEHNLRSSYPRLEGAAPAEVGRKESPVLLLESSQIAMKKVQEQFAERLQSLEEDLAKSRSEIISLRAERDKLVLEANFARERLDRLMKEFEHQRGEAHGVLARNVEFSQLIVDYQRRVRESSESLLTAEELSRKLTMEVSILKQEKDMLVNSEKRASDEVRSLLERVHRLQASLDTIQSAEEVREEARRVERKKHEEYVKQIEREWAEAKKELQEERDNVRKLTLDRENTIKDAMRQVEEMGKELAKALHAVALAESRAAVAEARYSDLEKRFKTLETKGVDMDGVSGPSSSSTSEVVVDLRTAKDEIEKLKDELEANRAHMLQYKSIAQVNEAALKQMEAAHENFKIEADKLKKSLEAEICSLRERVSELENECNLKSKEAASVEAGKEEALGSVLAEIAGLKEEKTVKMSQIVALEIQVFALKEDLEKEHQRWRNAQANYERQVILQSETIQELTKTSEALALLQEEASELRRVADMQKRENIELKAKWEAEKSSLEKLKIEAETKYNEINEQNKILHNRLEAMHIKLAESDRKSAGISSNKTNSDPLEDDGLQNVVNYLRRSKEIAETEISLLKQEKLRLQSQLESALKAAETAQASLHAERANSRAMLFSEEEIKSLQLQVREMNLLRESNVQLREENKHNFEECQKLREEVQKAKVKTENLEMLLRERQIEVENCKKEIELQRMEKQQLEKRVGELLERCKNVDVEEYDRLKDEVQHTQATLREKDAEIEEIKKVVSDKQDVISRLEQDLAKSKVEVSETENRVHDILQMEAVLKSDLEKQKKIVAQLKKRLETLSKEKDELGKEKQALSKQLEESRQSKRSMGDATSEQTMKEKEKEKDTRIQILEKLLEREREDLRKEKDEHRAEKAKRQKTERTIMDTIRNVNQDKMKLVDELEKHKQASKRLSEELEKLKHAKDDLPEGSSVVELLSGGGLDDNASAYLAAVENFERISQSVFIELGAHPLPSETSVVDASSLASITGQATPSISPSTSPLVAPTNPTRSPSKPTEEKTEKRSAVPRTIAETRRSARRLIRPPLLKPKEPETSTEMTEPDASRKRPSSSSASDLQQESLTQRETVASDVSAPLVKKPKGSPALPEGPEGQDAPPPENLETIPTFEESLDAIVTELPQVSSEETIDPEKDEVVETTTADLAEESKDEETTTQQLDSMSQLDSQTEKNNDNDEMVVGFDDESKDQGDTEMNIQQTTMEIGSEREEGEMVPDNIDLEDAEVVEMVASPERGEGQASLARFDDESTQPELGEINSPETVNDEGGDVAEELGEITEKPNDANNQVVVDSALGGTAESTSTSNTVVEMAESKHSSVAVETELPAGRSSTIISLNERARERAMLRQAAVRTTVQGRARGRTVIRGRGGRGGRVGRGQTPNENNN